MPQCQNKQDVATTRSGKEIFVCQGSKSQYDFIVKFKLPNSNMRGRALTHAHLLSELHIALAINEQLAKDLRDYLLDLFQKLDPLTQYPPQIEFVTDQDVETYRELDAIRDFDVEFLMKSFELIMLQEKTNYPNGSLTVDLLNSFCNEERIMNMFRATFRG